MIPLQIAICSLGQWRSWQLLQDLPLHPEGGEGKGGEREGRGGEGWGGEGEWRGAGRGGEGRWRERR